MNTAIEGQLSVGERQLLSDTVRNMSVKPKIVIEIGTWLGGGSTLHILRALHENDTGHLWGIEADKSIYERMIANIRAAVPEASERFTPLFGFSTQVLPEWLKGLPKDAQVDVAFLDGGDNPSEQIEEFHLLCDHIRIGGVLMAHDARTRKGKWLVPYVTLLDNWETQIFDLSDYGLLHARKVEPRPSPSSLASATRALKRMRREPIELVARYTPSWLCGMILRTLPRRFARKLTIGKN